MAWTAFVVKDHTTGMPPMEYAPRLAPNVAQVHYDLVVIRLADEGKEGALTAFETAIDFNPKLNDQAAQASDMDVFRIDGRLSEFLEEI